MSGASQDQDDFTRRPDLRWFAWALLIVMAFMLTATLLAGRHLINQPPELFPPLSRIELPDGQCATPHNGDVLHITVTANDLGGQDLTVRCINAGPRPTWSGL